MTVKNKTDLQSFRKCLRLRSSVATIWLGNFPKPGTGRALVADSLPPNEPAVVLLSQSVELSANDRVALTRRLFQPFAVPHRDPPMCVADQSGRFAAWQQPY